MSESCPTFSLMVSKVFVAKAPAFPNKVVPYARPLATNSLPFFSIEEPTPKARFPRSFILRSIHCLALDVSSGEPPA